jgi:two-component system phosphate regulon sensor histidine kinase PhoR
LLVQDLTEIRRLEAVRRDFVSNVSHELRTPIASLKAISETLSDGAVEDPSVAREFLQLIKVEVDKLAQMINELGELSNIESGAVSLAISPTDIKLLAHGVADRLRAQLSRNELQMFIDIPDTLPLVMLDSDRIERVLVNLIHNSIKFTTAGGHITITASWKEREVVIAVADTGVGIESSELPRVFERLYKADKARSGGGTGLGLAIARHTVEAHGGRIWAESVYGKGTTIYFSLPVST